MLFYLLVIQLKVYKIKITEFIADDKVVYKRVRWVTLMASDNSWARRCLQHLSWRSQWIILCTLEHRMPVSREISWADRCIFGLSSWLSTKSSTAVRWTWSVAAWLPDNSTRSCGLSSADCQCFQVSKHRREIHSTGFLHFTALTDKNWLIRNFHDFV